MKTLQDYLDDNEKECTDNNINFNSLISFFNNEWINELYNHLKAGGTIPQEIYNSLSSSQKWYINKHYLIHGIKVIE